MKIIRGRREDGRGRSAMEELKAGKERSQTWGHEGPPLWGPPFPPSLTCRASSQRAFGATCSLHVPIKPRFSPPAPVLVPIVIRPRPRMQKTKKHMPRRTNHNSRMPPPHHQIPGQRLRHALKPLHSVVQIIRTSIGIWKTSALVNRMHQVRTVPLRKSRRLRIERGSNHCQPIIGTQSLNAPLPVPLSRSPIRSRARRRWRPPIVPDRTSPFLRPHLTKREPTQSHQNRGLCPIRHRPIVMPIRPSAMVTIVQRLCVGTAPSQASSSVRTSTGEGRKWRSLVNFCGDERNGATQNRKF
jgi:hypothetical protein